MYRKLMGAAAVAATLAAGSTAFADDLNFGIISTESQQNLAKVWRPFLKDMAKKTGLNVRAFYASDYAGVIEGMRFKKVDAAWFGNKSAIVAVDRAGGEVFAQTVDSKGAPGYWSLLITHADSKLNSVKDALACKSCNFGNGDPNSTSGFAVPGYYIFALNNVEPRKHFKRVTNASHEANALAVATKKVDFATNNTESMARIKTNFPQHYKNIKVIWKSPLIPSDPLVWRKDLSADKKQKLKNFILTYGTTGPEKEKELKILAALQWAPFRESSNKQLYPIRKLELFKARLKLERKGNLSDEDKKKMADINAKLKKIEEETKTN